MKSVAFVYITLLGLGLFGWIHNIITVYHSSFAPLTGSLILRIVGVAMVPLGAVLGYF